MKRWIVASMLLASFSVSAKGWPAEPKDTAVKIDAYLKLALKDPESARDYAVTQPFQCRWGLKRLWCVCSRVNAKNSYGGYTGVITRIAYFSEAGDIKIFGKADISQGNYCSNQQWADRDAALIR